MTETEYKRKLKRLEWLMGRSDELNTKVYDDDISELSDELHRYESKEFFIPEPDPIELILFHIDRTGIKKSVLADKMNISKLHFYKLINLDAPLTDNMKKRIMDFDFNTL